MQFMTRSAKARARRPSSPPTSGAAAGSDRFEKGFELRLQRVCGLGFELLKSDAGSGAAVIDPSKALHRVA